MEYWKGFVSILLLVINGQLIFGYKAAVFEHAQQSYALPDVPKEIIRNNLQYYRLATSFAGSKGVDVIVFPEYGIFPPTDSREKLKNFLEYIPVPNVTSSNPCEERKKYSDSPILYTLSCLARKNRMIVVANMGDIQPCEGQKECPKDGVFHFNTNVAFGRDGRILAKYHKEHLFDESAMDLPIGVQDPTFETNLGRFAMFVCFDIVFQRITEVAHWKGVKAILLPTMWGNSSPLFNSIQYFESWANGNNVTLLAANVQIPGMSGIGSGIMKGREGARVYTFNPDGHSKLLISDLTMGDTKATSSIYVVSKNEIKEWTHEGTDVESECSEKVLKPAKDVYKDYRCLERSTQNFTLQKLTKSKDRIELCHDGTCCVLDYTANKIREDYYLGVYNGTYNAINRYFFAEENCFLARCNGTEEGPCVTFPMRSETLFYNVYLRANFSTTFIYPTVMQSGMRLTPKNQWDYKICGKMASIHFSNFSGTDLLIVGFKGRAYDRDPPYV